MITTPDHSRNRHATVKALLDHVLITPSHPNRANIKPPEPIIHVYVDPRIVQY
jgi:hypothetical protein